MFVDNVVCDVLNFFELFNDFCLNSFDIDNNLNCYFYNENKIVDIDHNYKNNNVFIDNENIVFCNEMNNVCSETDNENIVLFCSEDLDICFIDNEINNLYYYNFMSVIYEMFSIFLLVFFVLVFIRAFSFCLMYIVNKHNGYNYWSIHTLID